MNSLTKLLLFVLCSTLFTAAANANVSIRIGKNCARSYYNSAERWHNNNINLDCVYVRRLTRASGGRIVVAVPKKRAHSFARKYGTYDRYRNRRHQAVKHAPRTGVFRRLEGDIAYLNVSGKCPDRIH